MSETHAHAAPETQPAAPQPQAPQPDVAPAKPVPVPGQAADTSREAARLARVDPSLRAAMLGHMQGQQGNAHVQRVVKQLQRTPASDVKPVQRFIPGDVALPNTTPPAPADQIQEAIDKRDKGLIKDIHDFSKASPDQKRQLMNILTDGWTGLFDENALTRIWRSFGDGILDLDASWTTAFQSCVENGMSADSIPAINNLGTKFKTDVKGVALGHLNSNHDVVALEAQRLKPPENADPTQPGPTVDAAAELQIQQQQDLAGQLLEVQQKQQALRTIVVGYGGMVPDQYGAEDDGTRIDNSLAYFDPAAPPFQPPTGGERPPMAAYDVVKKQWDEMSVGMAKLTDDNPALYALMATGKLESFKGASPEEGRNQIYESFNKVDENILETIRAISEDDLDHRDLLPIHEQVKSGPGASGVAWNKPMAQMAINKNILHDYQVNQERIQTVLGGVAMIAFLVAEVGTGGLATIVPLMVGVAASAAPAVMSWEKYMDMSTAANTAVKSGTDIVYKEQVGAVFLEALINTAAALLDLYGAGKTFRAKVLRPGDLVEGMVAANKAHAGIKALETMAGAERTQVIEQTIEQLGVAGAMSKSGRSADDLLAYVAKDSPAALRLRAYIEIMDKGGMKGLKSSLATLAIDLDLKKITREEAEQVVMNAIDTLGPKEVIMQSGGWKKMSLLLGNGSAAGKRLDAWRRNLWEDLKGYINGLELSAEERDQLLRTGSQDKWGSDLDMSSLGSLSGENRERAKSFLAGRAGIEPDKLGTLLYADFFTDPRRMHLLDQLPADVRARVAALQGARENEMMLKLMHQQAEASGDKAGKEAVEQMMAASGVKPGPVNMISKSEIPLWQQKLNGLQQDLMDPAKAAQKEATIQEIAGIQAQINVTEGGGYFTGGGVRREVTEREAEAMAGKGANEPLGAYKPGGSAASMTISQQHMALLDNALKLMQSSASLQTAKSIDEVAGAIKSIGKYGQRFTNEFGRDGLRVMGKVPGSERFASIADRFETWLLQAKGDKGSLAKLAEKAAEDPAIKVLSLQERLALKGEAQALTRDVNAAVGDFMSVLLEAHAELNHVTGLANIPKTFAGTQAYIMIHGKLLLIKDNVSYLMSSAIDMLNIAEEAGQAASESPTPAPAAPPSPPPTTPPANAAQPAPGGAP